MISKKCLKANHVIRTKLITIQYNLQKSYGKYCLGIIKDDIADIERILDECYKYKARNTDME